ncbi:MAG: DNA alkylation repair protein [Candidatus Altiarchaeota archaeon]|nr:DNA alkylation repair protein [Candidatus Altiarchaeota archaeon]
MKSVVLSAIRADLRKNSNAAVKKSGLRFFKEEVKLYGVKTATVSRIAKEYYKEIKDKEKKEIFDLCEELWASGCMEESFIAANWAHFLHDRYEPGDFEVFERWIEKYVSNWASCDTLCNHAVGEFIEQYPEYVKRLKKWARSKNKWMRRAAAVTLILPARKGLFLKDVFEIADILLKDEEDLVRKGYGWMLKEASKPHQKEVFLYVMKNKKDMPRTALRYAIEKMPEDMRRKAMAQGRAPPASKTSKTTRSTRLSGR